MNSTHASWLNALAAGVALLLPVLTTLPGAPAYVAAIALGVNAFLHALLPDAPK